MSLPRSRRGLGLLTSVGSEDLIPSCFYNTHCSVCRAFTSEDITLKQCSGCKLISYCGPQHQKLHWSKHKELCKTVQCLLKEKCLQSVFSLSKTSSNLLSNEEWKSIRSSSMLLVELTMKRKLLPIEREMFFFPRACQICHECVQEKLFECSSCHCVSYCSRSHESLDKEKHTVLCPILQLCYCLDNCTVSIDCNNYGIDSFVVPAQKEHEFLPQNMEQFVQQYFCSKNAGIDASIHIAVCSEMLTWPLTLLYCIEHRLRESNSIDESLVVHIVGASDYVECCSFPQWESILHRLPYVRQLKLMFIGPDVTNKSDFLVKLCSSCRDCGKKLVCNFEPRVYYEEYCKSTLYIVPDFVVAYNCGFHEYQSTSDDTWATSISFMLQNPKTVLVITSYTQLEAKYDLACVKQKVPKVKVLIDCNNNPFCSKRPYRDWETSCGVFFFNAFLSILVSEPA